MGILLKIFLIIFLFNKNGFFEFYCCIMVFIFRINVRFYSIVMWGIVVIFIGNYRIDFFIVILNFLFMFFDVKDFVLFILGGDFLYKVLLDFWFDFLLVRRCCFNFFVFEVF